MLGTRVLSYARMVQPINYQLIMSQAPRGMRLRTEEVLYQTSQVLISK